MIGHDGGEHLLSDDRDNHIVLQRVPQSDLDHFIRIPGETRAFRRILWNFLKALRTFPVALRLRVIDMIALVDQLLFRRILRSRLDRRRNLLLLLPVHILLLLADQRFFLRLLLRRNRLNLLRQNRLSDPMLQLLAVTSRRRVEAVGRCLNLGLFPVLSDFVDPVDHALKAHHCAASAGSEHRHDIHAVIETRLLIGFGAKRLFALQVFLGILQDGFQGRVAVKKRVCAVFKLPHVDILNAFNHAAVLLRTAFRLGHLRQYFLLKPYDHRFFLFKRKMSEGVVNLRRRASELVHIRCEQPVKILLIRRQRLKGIGSGNRRSCLSCFLNGKGRLISVAENISRVHEGGRHPFCGHLLFLFRRIFLSRLRLMHHGVIQPALLQCFFLFFRTRHGLVLL